jgi:hypothetical protein
MLTRWSDTFDRMLDEGAGALIAGLVLAALMLAVCDWVAS